MARTGADARKSGRSDPKKASTAKAPESTYGSIEKGKCGVINWPRDMLEKCDKPGLRRSVNFVRDDGTLQPIEPTANGCTIDSIPVVQTYGDVIRLMEFNPNTTFYTAWVISDGKGPGANIGNFIENGFLDMNQKPVKLVLKGDPIVLVMTNEAQTILRKPFKDMCGRPAFLDTAEHDEKWRRRSTVRIGRKVKFVECPETGQLVPDLKAEKVSNSASAGMKPSGDATHDAGTEQLIPGPNAQSVSNTGSAGIKGSDKAIHDTEDEDENSAAKSNVVRKKDSRAKKRRVESDDDDIFTAGTGAMSVETGDDGAGTGAMSVETGDDGAGTGAMSVETGDDGAGTGAMSVETGADGAEPGAENGAENGADGAEIELDGNQGSFLGALDTFVEQFKGFVPVAKREHDEREKLKAKVTELEKRCMQLQTENDALTAKAAKAVVVKREPGSEGASEMTEQQKLEQQWRNKFTKSVQRQVRNILLDNSDFDVTVGKRKRPDVDFTREECDIED